MAVSPTDYEKARSVAGLFDASAHLGRLFARGKDALDLLHRMSTNELKPIEAKSGLAAYTFLTNEKARIVDLLTVVRDEDGDVLLVTSKGKEADVRTWLGKFTIMEDAEFDDAASIISQFYLLGPKAKDILQSYSEITLDELPNMSVIGVMVGETHASLLKENPNRWQIFVGERFSQNLKLRLMSDVLAAGGVMMNDELFELLRIEAGFPIAPSELNEKHNPLETTLANEGISFTKGCYIGQEVIARLDAQGKVQRKLVGLKFESDLPQIGDRISIDGEHEANPLGDEIGDVTSVAISPRHGAIGLGYVRGKYANPGTVLSVKQADGNKLSASVVTLPFED